MGMLDKKRDGISADTVIALADPVAETPVATPAADIGPQRAAPRSVAAIEAEGRLIASWLAEGVRVDGPLDESELLVGVDLASGESFSEVVVVEVPPEKIPLPASLAGPCEPCGNNPLFWEDRWGAVKCCQCNPPPTRALFKRLLVMQRGLAVNEITGRPGGILEFWFVEAGEEVRNPWAKGIGVIAG